MQGPVWRAKNKIANGLTYYEKAGIKIAVGFFEGKADCICYAKVEKNVLDESVEMSENEVEQLLKANGGNRTWKRIYPISGDRFWQTTDGALSARYYTGRTC